MKKKLTNNIGMKLAALGLAVIVWLVIQSIADPQTYKDFTAKVEIRNEDVLTQQGDNYIYSIVSGDTVSFRVWAKTSVINRLSASDFNVYADMSKLSVVNSVPVEITARRFNDDIEIEQNNSVVKVELDELVEVPMNLSVDTMGNPEDGFAVGESSCNPSVVNVRGPKKILDNARALVASISVSGKAEDFTASVVPKLYDGNGDEIKADSVTMDLDHQTVEVSVEIWRTKTVDVVLAFDGVKAAENYAIVGEPVYSPKTIEVAGTEEALKNSRFVNGQAAALQVMIPEALTKTTSGTYPISEHLDPGLIIVDDTVRNNGISYRITVEPKVTAIWPVAFDKINIIGKNPDYTYRLEDGDATVSLNISGVEEELDKLKSAANKEIEISIDVSLCELGTYSIPVTAVFPGNVTLAGEQTISIVVESKENAGIEETKANR